jgi:penicillin amidase
MTRVGKLSIGFGCFALLLAGALGAAAWWGHRSIAPWSGDVVSAGLRQPIEIVRDQHAIPHVFAATEVDAYFGLGYVHAQDRLWQLELNRRLGSGRLSEIFGRDALERDRLFRTLGLRRAAEKNLEHLSPRAHEALDGYVRGINAFVEERPPLPPEFALFGVTPDPWLAADALVWLKVMAWMLSSNLDSELWRWRLSRRLAAGDLAEFFAPYPGDAPIVLEDLPAVLGMPAHPTGARWTPAGIEDEGLGSNNWVVSGERTKSAKPLLANDPHLGLSSPSIWYLAHLNAPGLNVIGATMPGLPGVILGRNDTVAWAFTNTGSDTQDLFLERLVPGDSARYETPGGSRAFDVVAEVIRIKGEPDEVLQVRISRHGPVISDVHSRAAELTPNGHALALAWTALEPDDGTLQFVLSAAQAKGVAELKEAARYFHSPPQNIVHADTEGNIGFVAAGRVPRRHEDNTLRGLMPAPGWLERFDWDGFIPFEALPAQQNPASGRIVTANQKITPPGYPYWISSEWAEPYRAERIDTLLLSTDRHSVESFGRMQLDVESGAARRLLPALLGAMPAEAGGLDARKSALLRGLAAWNFEMRAEAIEPLVYNAWVRELAREVYADELGELFRDAWAERVGFLGNVLAATGEQAHWCDDVSTNRAETCGERILRAFDGAVSELEARYGRDPASWSWGRAHLARARHFPMTRVPVLRDLFDVVTESSGGTHTINVGAYSIRDSEAPFESRHAAGFRAVYDLGDLEASKFLVNAGQSGHVLSPYYRNWAKPWLQGALVPMLTERTRIQGGALGVLRIAAPPRASGQQGGVSTFANPLGKSGP